MCTGSSSTTKLPSWLSQDAQNVAQSAYKFYQSPYAKFSQHPGQPGQVVAGMTADQTAGFGALRNYYNTGTDNSVTQDAEALVKGGAGIKPGDISQYMDPYISGVLDPTLKNINLQASQQKQSLGDSATAAGAYGDFRHGVLENQLNRTTDEAVGNASNQAYSQAWQSALGTAGQNAQLEQQAGQGLYSIYGQDRSRQLGDIQALLSSGQAQQQQQQNLIDARKQQFQAGQQDKYDKLAAIISAISGVPYNKTTTQSNGAGGFAGLFGSLLSMATQGAA